MNEYRIKWQQCPHRDHLPQILFVEAVDADAAEHLARYHIERTHGFSWFSVHEVELYVRPQSGRVLYP